MNKVYASVKINNSDDVYQNYKLKASEQLNINLIAQKYMAFCEERWAILQIGKK